MTKYTAKDVADVLETVTATERAIAEAAFHFMPGTFGPRAFCEISFTIERAPKIRAGLKFRAKPASVRVWNLDEGEEAGPVYVIDLKAADRLHFEQDGSYWLRAEGRPGTRDDIRDGRAAGLREYAVAAVNELAKGRVPAPLEVCDEF